MNNNILLKKKDKNINGNIYITGSKSISNRILILQALYPKKITINNLSISDDTKILQKYIENNNYKLINVGHAGTTMRFLTAFFALKCKNKIIITGSARMKKRPISILVDCLNTLGANISYLENEGYPPLQIKKSNIEGGIINIDAKISSQYISALMLIGSSLKNGLNINLIGNIVSYPYIYMTYKILKKIGIKILLEQNNIQINYTKIEEHKNFIIESDWSSASYYYSIASLSNDCNLSLNYYNKISLQGDNYISNIYKNYFGINTIYKNNTIQLFKNNNHIFPKNININLNNTPDIAQTIAVTCALLKIKCYLNGLNTLKIKETDRLIALKQELIKIGVEVIITSDSLRIINFNKILNKKPIIIDTYEDHRMAMSFSVISIYYPILIKNFNVVTKSYPNFWEDLKKLKFIINKL